ncbi:hypothetical protein M0804_013442 [Polistes exclamans]|nr:hypothetical protein M0804_013442 [Polistes exclamans]
MTVAWERFTTTIHAIHAFWALEERQQKERSGLVRGLEGRRGDFRGVGGGGAGQASRHRLSMYDEDEDEDYEDYEDDERPHATALTTSMLSATTNQLFPRICVLCRPVQFSSVQYCSVLEEQGIRNKEEEEEEKEKEEEGEEGEGGEQTLLKSLEQHRKDTIEGVRSCVQTSESRPP